MSKQPEWVQRVAESEKCELRSLMTKDSMHCCPGHRVVALMAIPQMFTIALDAEDKYWRSGIYEQLNKN
ncbi:hypothetical protein KGP36_02385 [Patescibacteria group bacterium]|nr:hypothetical protein [Patescibacteria group bacterium]